MRLTLGLGGAVDEPTQAQLEQAIRSLPGGDDSYAVLARSGEDYRSGEYFIQTLGGPSEGYILEYREGSAQHHFQCSDPGLTTEAVLAAFLDYFRGRARYKADLPWVQESPENASCLPTIVLVVVLVAVVGLLAYWFVF